MAKNPWSKGGDGTAVQPPAPAEQPSAATSSSADTVADTVQAPPVPPVVPQQPSGPRLVRMVRETPLRPGGATTADVPESDVALWAMHDWKVNQE